MYTVCTAKCDTHSEPYSATLFSAQYTAHRLPVHATILTTKSNTQCCTEHTAHCSTQSKSIITTKWISHFTAIQSTHFDSISEAQQSAYSTTHNNSHYSTIIVSISATK